MTTKISTVEDLLKCKIITVPNFCDEDGGVDSTDVLIYDKKNCICKAWGMTFILAIAVMLRKYNKANNTKYWLRINKDKCLNNLEYSSSMKKIFDEWWGYRILNYNDDIIYCRDKDTSARIFGPEIMMRIMEYLHCKFEEHDKSKLETFNPLNERMRIWEVYAMR